MKGIKYNSTFGLKKKDKTLIANLINKEITDNQLEIIEYNIDKFREIVNG